MILEFGVLGFGREDEQSGKRRRIFWEGIFCWVEIKRRWKRKIVFEKGKYIFQRRTKAGKKNEEYIWRRKICFLQGRRLIVKEKDENIWRRKMCFLRRRRITEKEKLDHLQEAGQSGWSFAKGWSILMIICKRLIHPDDLLQAAGHFGWSFVRGRSIRMIIYKRPVHPDDLLQEGVPIPHICHFFYTDRIFENQILHPKKRLKAPKTLKMSLKKSYAFFHSIWKNWSWWD